MKKKTMKKIVLTRETLRSLDDRAAQDAAGGLTTMPATCNASCLTDATRGCSNCNVSFCVC